MGNETLPTLAGLRPMFDRVPTERTLAQLGVGLGDENPATAHDPFNIGMSEALKPRESGKGIRRRAKDGFLGGFGDRELGIPPGHPLYLSLQPVAAPADLFLRTISGGMHGAAGALAGVVENFGVAEPMADRLQRDLGIAGQYPGFAVSGTPRVVLGRPAVSSPPLFVRGPGGKLTWLEDVPTTIGDGSGHIYRAGDTSPSNLTPRPGETTLSFRSSVSEPYPKGRHVVFNKSEYRAYDPTKLAPGSVTYDKYPDGHVSVQPPPINSIEDLKRAVVGDKGKMQR
jgi:hypothetical protein